MSGESFVRLVELMRRLRGPDGCPWDRQQTFATIKPYLLEETYEVVEAIDNGDFPELRDELGDLLLQVVFFSQMAAEAGYFTIDDVIEAIHTKLIRRHPHVFGNDHLETPDQVRRRWSDLKEEERRQAAAGRGEAYVPRKSVLDGVSRAVPALIEAFQLTDRAAFAGFDWPSADGILEKMEEEMAELRKARTESPASSQKAALAQMPAKVEEEVGDLLFTAVNLARGLGIEPESALRKANRKFRSRFTWMEERLAERNQKPAETPLDQLEELWQRAKLEMARK